MSRLRLLDGVSWAGSPLPGERVGALLACLAAEPAGVSDSRLVAEIWGDDEPVHPAKALQVLVSRVRAATDAALVQRLDGGYRLGVPPADVDAAHQAQRLADARRALAAGDATAALEAARAAAEVVVEPAADGGPLGELRRDAGRRRTAAREAVAHALARLGRHAEALEPLREAHERHPDDVATLEALLRAEAATAGAATALRRYEQHRAGLADRLGVDPDPALQRLHAELLAADDPVRSGVRYDAGGLLGRGGDLEAIRAAVASGRLTTVTGPGGIGKTSVAMLLARESTLPRVHVVELAGVGAGDDVVAAVGAALGVRGSVAARHVLTAVQQADVRQRVAQELDAGPALLVLDNCEHVLEPVASLVAFLLATTRDLRVLATSRAPLRLSAERVVPLTQLTPAHAAELFERRARAVRPDAELDADQVLAVVSRLDGLPLAVELAAARVRTMTVAEVAAALADRFATLRTRDRGTPDRHRTLAAVIGWSWDLLTDEERRALAWLSGFQDGFDLRTAAAVLGAAGPDLVEVLVDHSLLVVSEEDGTARFRALETVREFATLRLEESGERDAAVAAQLRWALEMADEALDLVIDDGQIALVDRLVREENNLTDVLRRALAAGDPDVTARLVALLGSLWTITGDQPRIFAVADAATEVLDGWQVPEASRPAAQDAAGVLVVHLGWLPGADLTGLRDVLGQGPPPTGMWGLVARTVHVAEGPPDAVGRLARLAGEQTVPARAAALLMWAALCAENDGDAEAATRHTEAALEHGPLPPYLLASLQAELSQLAMVRGDHHAAADHAAVAWPLLERLHSVTDAHSLRVGTALAPLLDGDVDTAEAILRDAQRPDGEPTHLQARMVWLLAHAEVALVRGDVDEALRRYDDAVSVMTGADGTGGHPGPWRVIAATAALVARARHGAGAPDPRADELRDLVLGSADDLQPGALWFTDLPLNGILLVALAAWELRFGEEHHDDGCRLLAIAQRWAYNRSIPVMAWEPLRALADAARPGRVDELLAEYAGRPGPELLPDAVAAVERLRRSRRSRLTSS